MNDKPKMYYCVRTSPHSVTKEPLHVPYVVDRKTLNLSQVVEYAKTVGYMRGQQEDLEGLVNGFIDAMRDRAKAGYSIDVNDWFLVRGYLRGTLDETQRLGANNSYCVRIKTKKELKFSLDDFSWTCVDSDKPMHITGIFGAGGKSGVINPNGPIVATGTNLACIPGDTLTMSWIEGNLEKTIVCAQPRHVTDLSIAFNWPKKTEIPEGTEVTLTYRLRRTPESAAWTIIKTVTVGAPSTKDSPLK